MILHSIIQLYEPLQAHVLYLVITDGEKNKLKLIKFNSHALRH